MILDWNEYLDTARQAAADGIVLLENKEKTLPFESGLKVAVFGRMQNHYYKSGTGSGGMVNVSKVWGILDGLLETDVVPDSELMECYREFDRTHPYAVGVGFGNEPWSQEEMPIDAGLVEAAAKCNEAALVIIARTAGEEQDSQDTQGAYRLSSTEKEMLSLVCRHFKRTALVLNTGGIMDMKEILEIGPSAIAYVWQGGMQGGLGAADVLTGKVCPSGRLTDTIAEHIEDYPAYGHFGDPVANAYVEDIYVGYRYFETFARDRVIYPFGYGLSYTSFQMEAEQVMADADAIRAGKEIYVSVKVTNCGTCSGRQVVQIYVKQPGGLLGKPACVLAGYGKTKLLAPKETGRVEIAINPYYLASYDDSELTDVPYAYQLERGRYGICLAENAASMEEIGSLTLNEDVVLCRLTQALAPRKPFDKMVNRDGKIAYQPVLLQKISEQEHRLAALPVEYPYTGNRGIRLVDVRDGRAKMEDFVAQIGDEDLAAIIRGEGMGSPKVTPGTAAAFGGVTKNLRDMGVPCGCCSDGPSGMRLDCGTKAFSLPNGTLLASTFDDALNEHLYSLLGMEMTKNKVDCLLGPGMNLHRHPLNGRNFEYFSEDPLLTGKIAAAQIRGLQSAGVTGTLKHFCGNNQEKNRHSVDSVISERALRELYLKGFEIAVREGHANCVMTTYGAVNGIWTDSRYDLCTQILRTEWGFQGLVMTDWWASIGDLETANNASGFFTSKSDYASLVRAQNDFYAVCPDASINSTGDNTLEELAKGGITRGELERAASNILSVLLHSHALERLEGEKVDLTVLNYKEEEESINMDEVVYYPVARDTTISLESVNTEQGRDYVFGVDVEERGVYRFILTGASDLSALAQMPVSVYFQSIMGATLTWNGTGGQWLSMERKMLLSAKYGVVRLHFGGSGLKLKDLRLVYEGPLSSVTSLDGYIYG